MTVYVALAGGLGNQLFQYAAARALARRAQAALVVDTWSGFVRDRWFRRAYELGPLPLAARVARPFERLPIWLLRTEARWRPPIQLRTDRAYGRFLVEQGRHYHPDIDEALGESVLAWMVGYWQSPRYFDAARDTIVAELMPTPPEHPHLRSLGEHMAAGPSLAVGVRLYEESSDARLHARDGRVKSMADLSSAVARVRTAVPDVKCYVFCTHQARALADIALPPNTTLVIGDDGGGPLDTLWLLSRCRHHVFTNSSLYWWGAYLSANVHTQPQHILAADNFLNRDGLLATWGRF